MTRGEHEKTALSGKASPDIDGSGISYEPTSHLSAAYQRVTASPTENIRHDDMMVLQQTIGNRAVRRLLRRKVDKGNVVPRQQYRLNQPPPAVVIQRRTDPVIVCPKTNPEAGLIHLHGSEQAALQAAQQLYCQYCVNLMFIGRQQPNRLVQVDTASGVTCCADPNRIFDDSAIESNWNSWNKRPGDSFDATWGVPSTACRDRRCRRRRSRGGRLTPEQQAVKNYRDNVLVPAIIRTASPSALPDHALLPFVVFHGNTATRRRQRSLSVLSYCSGGIECRNAAHCATERRNLTVGTRRIRFNSHCRHQASTANTLLNPHIDTSQRNNIDDFILVTRQDDFVSLAGQGRNVILQSTSAPNDGSLSIALRSGRYVNVEAQRATSGHRTSDQARNIQVTMGEGVLHNMMGVNSVSGNNCPSERSSTECPSCNADNAP